jgi:aldose sugar dehydrogenase
MNDTPPASTPELPEAPNVNDPQAQKSPFSPQSDEQPQSKRWLIISILFILAATAACVYWLLHDGAKTVQAPTTQPIQSSEAPSLKTEVVLSGRMHVWDMQFLPGSEMIFTERAGSLSLYEDGKATQIAKIADVSAVGEGGLMGLAVDPKYAENHYIYTCYKTTKDIRVVRWVLPATLDTLTDRTEIVTGIPANPSGRHSGCRVAFGLDGYLWVGTGDTAQNLTPQTPQDPKSLGGKILRVDRTGKAAPGNLGGAFDARIYSYGHRNTQGLAFFTQPRGGVLGVSVEHGSSVDDEVNPLKAGNFGWAPPDGAYDESGVPMTDKERFPDAINAIWSSGNPTQAPSGVAVLHGSRWKAWDGALAVAVLKDKHLKILTLDDDLKVVKEDLRLEGDYGRLRAVTQGPDGALYISSSNSTNDKIIRLTPQ